MSRPPHGRRRVLEAARELILGSGVRSLTLTQLEFRSGVTRGGILYHWPDRQALIEGLLLHDLEAWDRRCRELAAPAEDPMAGKIRCALDTRGTAGLVAAALTPEARRYPDIWKQVELREQRRFLGWSWDDRDVLRYVLLLASEGAMWRRAYQLEPDVPGLEDRVCAVIEQLLSDGQRPVQQSQGNP